MRSMSGSAAVAATAALCFVLSIHGGPAESAAVDFGSEAWTTRTGGVVEHAERSAFAGFGFVEGVSLGDCVIEVDLYATGATSYPGIVFRMQDEQNYEWIYVRPHRANQYPDAAQYSPAFNGISSWQLCNGDGYTAGVELPENEWIHLRIEVSGSQAKLYAGDMEEPVLHVKELKRGREAGAIGLRCPADGSAYFSNLEYREDEPLTFEPVPPAETPPGTITTWEISQAFSMGAVDLERPPSQQSVGAIEWREVQSEPSGLVEVGRYVGRTGRMPDCVFARATLTADAPETLRLEFGYSDAVCAFLNGELLFTASNAYRQRDPTALGIIGYFDALYLPLEAGENTLEFIVTESFGGWGFMARDGDAKMLADDVHEAFEVEDLLTPECVVYDPEEDAFYVTNYDIYGRAVATGGQYITKLAGDGGLEELRWVSGLTMPTGMTIVDHTLWVVERRSLTEIDLETGEILARHEIPGAGFPNDVAADASGALYVSDSRASAIHRFMNGEFELWLSGGEVEDPNAVTIDGDVLLLGNNGDRSLKAIDLGTKEASVVARFREGNIDGIAVVGDGGYLVSNWEGRLYRVSPDGEKTRILDTSVVGGNVADFEYVAEKNLVVVPAFMGDSVAGYRLTN